MMPAMVVTPLGPRRGERFPIPCNSCDTRNIWALTLQLGPQLCPRLRLVRCDRAREHGDCRRLAVGYREFVDDAGTFWRVWDTYPVAANTLRAVSPNYAGGWLTFESDAERRRLAPIPPEWEFASRNL